MNNNNEFDQLTDRKCLDPKTEDLGHTDEVRDIIVGRKGRVPQSSWNSGDITGTDQEVNDRDAEAFDIIPDISELKVGESIRLFAFAKKSDKNLTPNDPNVVWESDNWDVAFFTDNGVLHARKVGEAIIKATDIENYDVAPVEKSISVVPYSQEPGGNDNPDPVDPGTDPNPGDNPGGDQPGGNTDPDPGTDPQPQEPEVVKPEVHENTEAQNQVADSINETLLAGTKTFTVPDGETLNNIVIPEEVTVIATITGEIQDGATIETKSSKGLTIVATNEDPVNVSVKGSGSIYLKGKYNDVYLNGNSLSGSSSTYANIAGTLSIEPLDETKKVNVTADFQDGAKVVMTADNALVVNNANEATSVEVYAPNATVEMGGKYNEVTATVSKDTLVLKSGFHATKLDVLKGNVKFYGIDIADFADSCEAKEGTVEPMSWNVPTDVAVGKMSSNAGIYKLVEDYTGTTAITFGMFGNGRYKYDLNGHTVTMGSKSAGCIFVRGTAEINIYGPGKLVNNAESYGVWVSGGSLNVYSGDFEAYTHVLYAEKGTINVYGGTFKCLSEDKKFLLNCLDANYTSGDAKITVYGGKFYEFNPAASMGEPGGPVSFVAPGYKVIESEEDGKAVFEVVPE